MVRVAVNLFGELQVFVVGEPVALSGRNERRLLAHLALRHPSSCERRTLAENLWPGTPFEVAGNRLRTALVGLRKAFGPNPPIRANRVAIGLAEEQVEIDLQKASRWDDQSKLAQDPLEQEAALSRLLATMGPGLLPAWDDPWLADDQLEWRVRRHEAMVRASELALRSQQFERAREFVEPVLSENPTDGFAWSPYLIASARLGQARHALGRFQAVRKVLAVEGQEDFDEPLLQLAKAIRGGAYAPAEGLPDLPAGIDGMLVQSFRRLVQIDPGLAAKFVCSDAFRLEILRAPQNGVDLLEHLLRESSVEGPDHVALRLMTLRTHSLLRGAERVLELGERLLEEPLEPAQLRLVLTLISFSHFNLRNLTEAFHFVDRAIEVADAHSPPHHRLLTRADRALYVWHQGDDREALATLRDVYEATKDETEAKVSYAPAYLCGLIGSIHAMAGEFDEAEKWLQRGHSLAKVRQYREQVHQIESPYGYVLAVRGSMAEGARMTASGLAHFVQSGNTRDFAAALDFAAGLFTIANEPGMALDCLQWGRDIRAQFRHARTQAETRFVDSLLMRLDGATPSGSLNSAKTPRQAFEIVSMGLAKVARPDRSPASR